MEKIKHKLTCKICNRRFPVYPSELKTRQFCSVSCANLAQQKRIKRTCEACGKVFTTTQSSIKAGRGKTCSKACQYSIIGKKIQAKHPQRVYHKKCKHCERAFTHRDRRQKFCSRSCWLQWNSGKNHFNYKNGEGNFPHPLEFSETLKAAIRKRDCYQCHLCGTTKNYRKFPVHHIDYYKNNNDALNLITLCDSCHVKTNYHREYWASYFQSYMNTRFKNTPKQLQYSMQMC